MPIVLAVIGDVTEVVVMFMEEVDDSVTGKILSTNSDGFNDDEGENCSVVDETVEVKDDSEEGIVVDVVDSVDAFV